MDFVDVNIGKNEDIMKVSIYLNSVINFSIWKTRNKIKFEFSSFDIQNVFNKIIRSMRGRCNIDNQLLCTRRVPMLRDLTSMFLLNTKKFMPIDNG